MGITKLIMVGAALSVILGTHTDAAAHCDTLDGPVVQDARRALARGEVTPVLKWVREQDEKEIAVAFRRALAARGKKGEDAEEQRFFEALVRIHRAGEGETFSGLKPAAEVDPVIALADRALAEGDPAPLVAKVTEAVKEGVARRYKRVAEALKHKDESVSKGREYVAAYVAYTHYVEWLEKSAAEPARRHQPQQKEKHPAKGHRH